MLRFTRRAEADFEAILAYLQDRSPAGAARIARTIDETAKVIAQFPGMGRMSAEDGVRFVSVARFPYLIYWRVEGGDVWIVHIRHTSREPWTGGD